MKILLSLLLIFLAIYQHAFAQRDFKEGYIVTNEGDSISGWIKYQEGRKSNEFCAFKKNETDIVQNYTPDQIKGYRFTNNRSYETHEIKIDENRLEKIFLEVLIKGTVSLYRSVNYFYIQKNGAVLRKLSNDMLSFDVDGQAYQKPSLRYISSLKILLSDCEAMEKKIPKVQFHEKSLTTLIEQYNKCIGQSSTVFKSDMPWFKMGVGISLGYNLSKLNIPPIDENEEHLHGDFDLANSFIPGIFLNFSSPRISEKSSFYIGLFYLNSTYKSISSFPYFLGTNYNEVEIKLEQLKIPIGYRYTFSKSKFKPYINLGISLTYNLSSSSWWIQKRVTPPFIDGGSEIIEIFEGEALELDNNEVGFWGGFGVKKSISEKLEGFLELRIEQSSGPDAVDEPKSITNFQFSLGIIL